MAGADIASVTPVPDGMIRCAGTKGKIKLMACSLAHQDTTQKVTTAPNRDNESTAQKKTGNAQEKVRSEFHQDSPL